ncbi:MAG TPA: CehA/McbA family metallohydrolase [Planctomycetota bacterium]|nr:CehA/McbA family metallohydrolase [Planctomycetota bacterium]
MTLDNAFDCDGQWLKGNLHTHTTVSDGDRSPQERVADYEAAGYDFLALTDHDRLADLAPLSAARLVVLRGIELVCANPTGGPGYHLVGLDLPEGFCVPRSKQIQTVVDAILDCGGQAVLAHPYWTGQTIKDLEVVSGALGVEVFNSTCETTIGKGTSAVHWDDLLARGRRLLGVAVDDTHRATRDGFQGWVVVRAAERSREAIMDALSLGRFYATCGPTIESVRLEGNRVTAVTSPVVRINFICNGSSGRQVRSDDGSPITQAEHLLGSRETYVRVECTDQAGRSAWANPFFLR